MTEVITGTNLRRHPAAEHWREAGGRAPTSIEVLQGRRSATSQVFRLLGTGDPSSVIAKRGGAASLDAEHAVYCDVLPEANLSGLQVFGMVGDAAESARAWLFLEDLGEQYCDLSDEHNRRAVTEWIAMVHVATASPRFESLLRRRDEGWFRTHLDSALHLLAAAGEPRQLTQSGLEVLASARRELATLGDCWRDVLAPLQAWPKCLVHLDLNDKNLGWRRSVQPVVGVFDWEQAGWGSPAPDVERLDALRYHEIVGFEWRMDAEAITELQRLGRILRLVISMSWACESLRHEYIDRAVSRLALYVEQLRSLTRHEATSS